MQGGLLLLAGRDASVRTVILIVPVAAVGITATTQARSYVVIRAVIPKMPGIVSTRTAVRRRAAVVSTATFGIGSFNIAVFIDDVAAITAVHPVVVADFLPFATEAGLTKVFALIAGAATESDTSSGCGKATAGAPAVVSARAVPGHMDASTLFGVARVIRACVAVVAV